MTQAVKKDKDKDVKPVSIIVHGKKHDDMFNWASLIIERGKKVRDQVRTISMGGFGASRTDFISRTKAQYNYYRDLLSALYEEGSDVYDSLAPDELLLENDLLQVMRAKLAILTSGTPSWRYKPLDAEETDRIDQINQILPIRLEEEEYTHARVTWLAQASCYGVAVPTLFHDQSQNEPFGQDHFDVLDPLGFLWEFGANRINGRGAKRSSIFIAVRMLLKGDIERNWGREVNKPHEGLVEPREFSILHALAADRLTGKSTYGELDDEKIPEIQIWIDDTSTEAITKKKKVVSQEPVLNTQTGEYELDESGNILLRDVESEEDEDTGFARMSFPKGRLIVFAGRTLMFNGNNPYAHGQKPFGHIVNTWDGLNFVGLSDVDIGVSTQRAKSITDNSFYMNIRNFPGIAQLAEEGLTDKEKGIEKDENGLLLIRKRAFYEGDVLKWIQPASFTQDQYFFNQDRGRAIEKDIGVQQQSYGRTKAADSGIKVSAIDDIVTRFHGPMLQGELLTIAGFARQWLYNLNQYDKMPRAYTVENEMGMPQQFSFAGQGKVAPERRIEIIPAPLMSNSEAQFAKLIEMKGVLGPELPANSILKRSGIPELVTETMRNEQTMAMMTELVKRLKGTGILEKLLPEIVPLEQQIEEGNANAPA